MKTVRRVTTLAPRRAAVGALVGVAVLALAACGSSSSSGSGGSATSEPPAATSPSTTASTTTETLKTADNAKFGTILVDSEGRTLYTLTNGGQPVACTGACASVWPPLLVNGAQVSAHGLPLYRFSGDPNAGDANGDGITSFGGTWHVATQSVSSTATSSSVPPTTPAGSTTTYGY